LCLELLSFSRCCREWYMTSFSGIRVVIFLSLFFFFPLYRQQ
jgi:hypothetical protein